MMRYFLILLFFLPSVLSAQQWKRYRKEYVYGIGATNFLGDLGGGNTTAQKFIFDIEPTLTRPAASVGYRYRLTRHTSVKGGIFYGIARGDDKLTTEIARNNRNLHFRSNIFELSGQYEFSFINERQGHRYQIKGVKGWKNINIQSYFFAGLGIFYFNPKAQLDGKWHSLQPLGTEGQGLPGERKKYSRINIAVPFGIGFKYGISRTMTIGLEYGPRKTFTDYIDDVSSTYYDKSVILDAKGEKAAYFADPSSGANPGFTAVGERRGKPGKDWYMFGIITLSHKIKPRRTKAKF